MSDAASQVADPVEQDHADARPADSSTEAPAEPCADQPLELRIEALLLSTERPLTEARMADLLGQERKGAAKRIGEGIESLNASYTKSGRSFRIEKLAGGWQILTLPEFGPLLQRQHAERQTNRLSQAALETLAIVAYRQPMMRAEIEAIRGVACGEVLRGLLERRLIAVVGRAEELGRPMLYGTTPQFLKVFGLSATDDLPEVQGLQPGRPAPPKPAEPKADDETTQADDDSAAERGTTETDGEQPTAEAPAEKPEQPVDSEG